MAEDNAILTLFYSQWQVYQDHIKAAVESLAPEQLTLRAAPGLRSIGENVTHIIGCRIGWLTYTLGEDGGEEAKSWGQENAPTPTGAELARGLEFSWQFMRGCFERWSATDMQQTFPDEDNGQVVYVSRAWVVWHLLEHDLHHGGEVALTLGIHGLPSGFTS